MAANVSEVNDTNFDAEVLKSQAPVLVDFWAPWCGPCRRIAPIVEELATQHLGAGKVVKGYVGESPRVAADYDIHSIPTLMIFKNGDVVERFVGLQPKSRLDDALREAAV
jgi:thioredoxin 1